MFTTLSLPTLVTFQNPRLGALLFVVPVSILTIAAAILLFTPGVKANAQLRRWVMDLLIVGSLGLAVMDLGMALDVRF